MSKWVHNRVFGRGRGAAAFACFVGLASASTAHAAESSWPTAQAVAAHAEWVPYLDPPPKPAAICLVDSGINITPDTPADSPEGPILERTALDGGSGEAVENDHGTYLAMVAGAPVNGWGTTGLWPKVRIVSVRAMRPGQSAFQFDDYRRALTTCTAAAATYNIAVVNLSLGCNCTGSTDARGRLDDQIAVSHHRGLSLVASAGNAAGAVGAPANEPGVFAVSASEAGSTALCSFSNRGPGVALAAPGCNLDGADPVGGLPFRGWSGGTSAAAVLVSTALAMLRSYRPDLDWESTERLAQDSSAAGLDAHNLDVEAMFRAAGLGAWVDRAKARIPSEPVPPSTQVPESPGSSDATGDQPSAAPSDDGPLLNGRNPAARLRAPRLGRVVHFGRQLTVSVTNRPRAARLVIALQGRASEFGYLTIARAARRTDTLRLRLPHFWRGGRLLARYEQGKRGRETSVTVTRQVGR